MAKLDCLSRQFIQRAKTYQTVVKTMATLEKVDESNVALANPELYIIVNGKPNKDNIMWHSLVEVSNIKEALTKLQEINWLYKEVDGSK